MREANFDGLVGPTHNYAGLSEGNVASKSNALAVSRPKLAALQGLSKMERVMALGLPQGFLPPHERPATWVLRGQGFSGSDTEVIAAAARERPEALARACSASAMWTANAATVAPGADTADGRTRLVVANLRSMPHRGIEPPQTLRTLKAVFPDPETFDVRPALPVEGTLGDEGAANHTRLLDAQGHGVHLFVFGARAHGQGPRPTRHPARQTLEGSQEVARSLRLPAERCVFLQQNPAVIDHGVFHNDVIAVGSEHTLLFHEDAFVEGPAAMEALRRRTGDALVPVPVHRDELAVSEAVSTYLFNSQLLQVGAGSLLLVCPEEVRRHDRARAVVDRILADGANAIRGVLYLDVRESMRNGGGPACLRLRVPLTADAMARVHPGFLLDAPKAAWLRGWIERHYPDELRPADLADPLLHRRSLDALDELARWLGVGALYPFQGAPQPW
jgi:succinylarginine dihydrolase